MERAPPSLCFCLIISFFAPHAAGINITYVSLHTDFGNVKYGYYVAAPITEIATQQLRKKYPDTLANFTWIRHELPGFRICDEASKLISDFAAQFFYKYPHLFSEDHITVFGCSGKMSSVFAQRVRSDNVLAFAECSPVILPLADLAREWKTLLTARYTASVAFSITRY